MLALTDERTLAVSEIFGPTVQGEGPSTGQRAKFLRLGGCNLTCSWCDTSYTWDWKKYSPRQELTQMSLTAVKDQLFAIRAPLLVITGGEPLLQRESLHWLLWGGGLLFDTRIEFETNGTKLPFPKNNNLSYNVSPKLAHGGDPKDKRIVPVVLECFSRRKDAIFKFVVEQPQDQDEIAALVDEYAIRPDKVWVMPQAQTVEELDMRLPWVSDIAIEHGWNLSDRLHLRLWEGKRGH